nr:glycosyltransferase [Halovulum dunhuangense]
MLPPLTPSPQAVPRVAVLMATFNGERWIEAQIASILASEGVAVHVFVSDDLSTDRTVEIARAAGRARLTVLPPLRQGSAARNFFRLLRDVDWSGFDHVALSDQDDIWRADKLSRATARIRADGLDAYSSDITAFWPDGRRRYIRKSHKQRRLDHLFESGGPGNTFVLPRASADVLRKRLGMIRSGWYLGQVRLIADIAGARTVPVMEYVRDPRPTRLWVPLLHFRKCRRRLREALMLLLILLDAGIRRRS